MMKPATVVKRPSIAKETPKEKTLSRLNSVKVSPSDAGQKSSMRRGATSTKTSNASLKETKSSQRHPLPSAGEKQGSAFRKKIAHSASDLHKKENQSNLYSFPQNQDISSQQKHDTTVKSCHITKKEQPSPEFE